MTPQEFRDAVGDRQIFGCTFTKRDGTVRTGAFRLGVRKGLKGVGSSYDREARGQVTVWDMNRGGYRTIRIDSIISITTHGEG